MMRVSFWRGLLGPLLLLAGLWPAAPALAQQDSLASLAGKLARYEQRGPQEKLYLHLDRPFYVSGETMWYRIYAVEGTWLRPLALSSVAYVEVLDARNRPVLQGKIPLQQGAGQGAFELPGTLASGTYTVRAYTRWMQNFGPETYFHSSVTIVNTFAAAGAAPTQDSAAVDVQFFPEGGHLVRGLDSRVAFKVTDRAGRGLAASGSIVGPQGTVVATFQTQHNGMGSFLLTPGVSGPAPYTALLTLAGRPARRLPLPPVQDQGYVLQLSESGPGQLQLRVAATSTRPETLYLLVHSRQHPAVATRLTLQDGRAALVLDKSQLLEGVSHFTLFDARQQPLCERLYFRRPTRRLVLDARPDQPGYAPRSRVQLPLTAAGPQAEPLVASLSLAVYRLDSLALAPPVAIDHYLSLTADLRGVVEQPEYYFTAPEPEATAAADHLMLTQGWSRFRWADVLTPTPLAYLPEPQGPVVQARLLQPGTTQPRSGITTFLSVPSRLIRLGSSRSTAEGLVQFELPEVYGPHDLLLQTNPQQDSTCRIELLDPFSARFAAPAPNGAYAPVPRLRADYARRHLQEQVQRAFAPAPRFRQPAPDSLAFYGKPDETYLLDKYTRFQVMEEVLREYVPGVVVRIRKDGFHFLVVDKLNKTLSTDNPMVLLDGLPVFNLNKIMAMSPLKIQRLDVIDSRYFHGPAMYSGLVSFRTYKGDLEGFRPDPRVLVQQYEGLQAQREFYAPRYDTPAQQQSRRPDLRNLLYWNPAISTAPDGTARVEFYTGDQAGRYQVVVQGLSATGLAGSTSLTFEVKPAL